MIKLIGMLIAFPFICFWALIQFMFAVCYAMFVFAMFCLQIIINFVIFLISLFSKNNRKCNYVDFSHIGNFKNNTKKTKKRVSNYISDFDKEADLWGLSEEDRRIAKEERMSPADYIEAEERDDDELFTDEWE